MEINQKAFSCIMPILDIMKALKMRISRGYFLRRSLQLSAYKGQSSNSRGQENHQKILRIKIFLKLI